MSVENNSAGAVLGKQIERIKKKYRGNLPVAEEYWPAGVVYHGDETRMEALSRVGTKGTWEDNPRAQRLASEILNESRKICAAVGPIDSSLAEVIARRANEFNFDPQRSKHSSVVVAGALRVIRFKTGK